MWKKKLTDAWSDYVLRQRMGGTGCFLFLFLFHLVLPSFTWFA